MLGASMPHSPGRYICLHRHIWRVIPYHSKSGFGFSGMVSEHPTSFSYVRSFSTRSAPPQNGTHETQHRCNPTTNSTPRVRQASVV